MRPMTTTHPGTGLVERSKVIRRTTCGKQGYTSKKLAKATAIQQSKMSGESIEAYHCLGCHAYHLGHVPGTERTPRNPLYFERPA